MKLKRNLSILILALTIVASGAWLTGKIAPEAVAWSSADLYQQAHPYVYLQSLTDRWMEKSQWVSLM